MSTAEIKHSINGALQHEAETGELRRALRQRLPAIQEKLVMPEDRPLDALMAFVVDYIENVPGSLSLVRAVSKQLGFFDYAAPFLRMAEDYFLQPPDEIPGQGGLAALLDEAFLAQRLMEELNDHHIRHLQRPLLPADMTEANLIVHYLLGDELASRLDQLVEFTASQLLKKEYLWHHIKTFPGVGESASLPSSSSALSGPLQQIRLRLDT